MLATLGAGVAAFIFSATAHAKYDEFQDRLVQACLSGLSSVAPAIQRDEDNGIRHADGPLPVGTTIGDTAPAVPLAVDHRLDGRARVRCVDAVSPALVRSFGGVPGGSHLAASAALRADGSAYAVTYSVLR